jgi:hypothetical protein
VVRLRSSSKCPAEAMPQRNTAAWSETPTGVFDSERAAAIGERILEIAYRFAREPLEVLTRLRDDAVSPLTAAGGGGKTLSQLLDAAIAEERGKLRTQYQAHEPNPLRTKQTRPPAHLGEARQASRWGSHPLPRLRLRREADLRTNQD